MATSQSNPNAAPAPAEFRTTTKGGIDLATFEQVDLFKKVSVIAPVTSIKDALDRLGNNQEKLLAVLTEGLQAESVKAAREDEAGWLTYDENGNETTTAFSGSLADGKDVNPIILQFAKLMFGFDDSDRMPAPTEKDPNATRAATTEEKRQNKRTAKESAMEYIKTQPKIIEAFKNRMHKASAAS